MSDDVAERNVFSFSAAEESSDIHDSVNSLVAQAGLRLSSIFKYDAVNRILREAELLGSEDLWLKPNKPMLLQGWWDENEHRNGRGLSSKGPNASDSLTQLVRLFMLRRPVQADIIRGAVGGNEIFGALLKLGVLYPVPMDSTPKRGNSQLLASSVQLFPLRGPAPGQTLPSTSRDLLIATDWHRRRPPSEAVAAVMTLGSDSQALAAWLRSLPCPSSSLMRTTQVLDLCTGSGVQAIMIGRRCPAAHLTLVDTSLRALRFARFNVLLNGEIASRRSSN